MKKRIEYMSYSKDSKASISKIAVGRSKSEPIRFYRNITVSTLERFQELQYKCDRLKFSVGIPEIHIMLFF